MWTSERYLQRLPDAYDKRPGSVNDRLLGLAETQADEAFADCEAVRETGDLNRAAGATLDLYGEMVNQLRGGLDDTRYRYLIRNRIARGFVAGDYESVLDGIVSIFEADKGEIVLQDRKGASGVVFVEKLPFSILASAGFTAGQALEIISALLPAGVGIEAENFEGTFCFSAEEKEPGETTGFSDHPDPEGQTMGGYLGFAIGEDESTPLPIVQ